MIAGTAGLCLLFFDLRFTPDLRPRRLLRDSCGIAGPSPGGSTV